MTSIIELFCAPHCRHCDTAAQQLRAWLSERDVSLQTKNILDHVDRAVDLGILRTPALVVDDELVHQGQLSDRRLMQLFGASRCPE